MTDARSGELIWATRGRSWGFRFLLDGGLPDPLLEYERAFAGVPDEQSACHRQDGKVALRFPDPEGRRDTAGRLIPHEFLASGTLAESINSLDDALHTHRPPLRRSMSRSTSVKEPMDAEYGEARAPRSAEYEVTRNYQAHPHLPQTVLL